MTSAITGANSPTSAIPPPCASSAVPASTGPPAPGGDDVGDPGPAAPTGFEGCAAGAAFAPGSPAAHAMPSATCARKSGSAKLSLVWPPAVYHDRPPSNSWHQAAGWSAPIAAAAGA